MTKDYKIKYIPVNRQKVIDLMDGANTKKKRTETYLVDKLNLTYATYWRRFKLNRWREEQVDSLCEKIGSIIGKKIKRKDVV